MAGPTQRKDAGAIHRGGTGGHTQIALTVPARRRSRKGLIVLGLEVSIAIWTLPPDEVVSGAEMTRHDEAPIHLISRPGDPPPASHLL